MHGWILGGGVLAVALAEFAVWTMRFPSRAALAGWAGRHGLELDDPATRESVRRQLRRGRIARTLGFGAAFSVGLVSLYLAREPLHAPSWYAEHQPQSSLWVSILASPAIWAAGYLVGAFTGELTRPHPDPWRLRGAPLSPRQLGGYLPTGMLAAERCLALAVIALTPLAVGARSAAPGLAAPTRVGIPNGIVTLMVALLLEVGLRLVVHRAQRVGSNAELAIDNAFRSTTVHRALAAGLAVQLFLLSEQGSAASFLVPWLADATWWVAAACFALAVRSWSGPGLPSRWRAGRPRTTVPPGQPRGR
jgi:hypothetical protein